MDGNRLVRQWRLDYARFVHRAIQTGLSFPIFQAEDVAYVNLDGTPFDSRRASTVEASTRLLLDPKLVACFVDIDKRNAAIAAELGAADDTLATLETYYGAVSNLGGGILLTGLGGVATLAAATADRSAIMRVSLLDDDRDARAVWPHTDAHPVVHVPLDDNGRLLLSAPLSDAQVAAVVAAVNRVCTWLDGDARRQVLVHCSQGQSRSAAFAAVVMLVRGHVAPLRGIDALMAVLDRMSAARPLICPAERFLPFLATVASVVEPPAAPAPSAEEQFLRKGFLGDLERAVGKGATLTRPFTMADSSYDMQMELRRVLMPPLDRLRDAIAATTTADAHEEKAVFDQPFACIKKPFVKAVVDNLAALDGIADAAVCEHCKYYGDRLATMLADWDKDTDAIQVTLPSTLGKLADLLAASP
jgi:hypothetical protein